VGTFALEAAAQNHRHAINTDMLDRLQSIYEAVWQELLRQRSPRTFPWTAERTRFLLARAVLKHARDYRPPSDIVRDVVQVIESKSLEH
jgi:hypothetical protein